MISLLAGKPNPTTFPFLSFEMKARSAEDPSQTITHLFEGPELAEGLQYGPTEGFPALLEWLYGLQEISHGKVRGEGDWSITVGNGAQDVIYKVIYVVGSTFRFEIFYFYFFLGRQRHSEPW
jgi:tryptophan aminotransferase